jgi:tetratricopeptide (TPR) repeat protein
MPSSSHPSSVPPVVHFSRLLRTGAVASVEDYLSKHATNDPALGDLLDLIQQEIMLREERGEVFGPADYCARFPAHADQVAALFAVHDMLGESAPAPADPTAPAVSGYEIGESLGRGGAGEVFRARDDVLGRPIAVKVLRPEWRDDPTAVARFWGEARITARLQHPGVAPLYEAGYDDRNRPFIAMKLVEGRTLAGLLADRTSPSDDLPRFVQVFEQICQTLAYAHARGVIHRDVKPANVMVGAFAEVQVMDWGLAKEMRSAEVGMRNERPEPSAAFAVTPHVGETTAGLLVGTPAYAPPEQARGEHHRVGPRSDVFGLGAVLCEILTGGPPFDSAEQARAGDISPAASRLRASAADAELIDLAVRCLSPEPDDRPPAAAAVAAAVDGYQGRLRERLRAAELAEARAVAERKARRRTEALRLIGVALVVGTLACAWAWARWQAGVAADVTAALDDGRAARDELVRVGSDPARLAAAERAARRAEGLLRTVVGRADLRGQLADLLAELEADARDPEVVRRLDDIRVLQDLPERKNSAEVDEAFEAAFRDSGIDVASLEPDEAARRLNRRAVRAALVTAVDYWGQQCLADPRLDARGRHLLAVAAAADPDPWRNRLRAALAKKDADALGGLAREAMTAELPTPTLVTLGAVVSGQTAKTAGGAFVTLPRAGEARPVHPHQAAGVAVLREAARRSPGDFWANHLLAVALTRTGRPAESVPYFAAAVALRPDVPVVRQFLASAYQRSGDFPAALRVDRDAVAAHPRNALTHLALANSLFLQGEADESADRFRGVLRIDPTSDRALRMLPRTLLAVGAAGEAREWAERLLATGAKDWVAVGLYADALGHGGRFEDAVAALRRAAQESRVPSLAVKLRSAEADAARAGRFPQLDAGTYAPRNTAEAWECVRVCYYGNHDRAAVRLAEQTLREPGAAAKYPLYHAYAAARLGRADGIGADDQARFRRLALAWLRSEMTRQQADAKSDDPSRWLAARRTVRQWQQHRDLLPLRDAALARLPEAERADWSTFWSDADELVTRIDAQRAR